MFLNNSVEFNFSIKRAREEGEPIFVPEKRVKIDYSCLSAQASYEREEQIDDESTDLFSEGELILSPHSFHAQLKQLKALGDFNERIEALWNALDPQEYFEGADLELQGRYCWIEQPAPGLSRNKSMLFRLFKDVFSSTSLGEAAYPQDLQNKNWYRIEVAEYLYTSATEGQVNEDPNGCLLEMHIDPEGRFSGIDWIRKGKDHSGSEVKQLALKIAKYLKIPQETLEDKAEIQLGQHTYSMRWIFSLIEHSEFPYMSWYERDGFLALQCQGLINANGISVSQNTAAYYQALATVRTTLISHLYSKVFHSTSIKKELLKAYQAMYPGATSKTLLADQQTSFSKLFSFLWNNREQEAIGQLFNFTYCKILNPFPDRRSEVSQASQTWDKALQTIYHTQLFIRNPLLPKREWPHLLAQLQGKLQCEEAQKALGQLASLKV